MRKWDIEDYLGAMLILALIGISFFIFKQMGKFDDCRERGGYAVDTKQGWICAKLEKI